MGASWLVLLLVTSIAHAIDQLDRVEIPISGKREDVAVLPIGRDGMVVLSSDRSSKDGTTWTFSRYDTDFERSWTTSHTLPGALARSDAAADAQRAVVAYLGRKGHDVTLLIVDVQTAAIEERLVELPHRAFRIEQLQLRDDDLWIVGAGKGEFLVHHDLDSAATTVVADLRKTAVDPVRLTSAGQAEVGLLDWRSGEMSLWTLDGSRVVGELRLPPTPAGELVLDAERLPLSDGSELVVGTYGARRARSYGAQGLYAAGLRDGTPTFERRVSFTEFERFFEYLPERRQERLARKAERKEAQGEDLRMSYRLLVHDIVERPDDLLVVAEAYYPEYHTYVVPQTVTVNGVTTVQYVTYTIFTGWRYTHAFVAALGKDGTLLWDHCFPIEKVLSPRLRERVRVSARDDGSVALVYLQQGAMHSLVVRGSEVVAQNEHEVTALDGATVKRDYDSDAEHWYDDTFLAWGTEAIDDARDGTEHVFWFAKMTAD